MIYLLATLIFVLPVLSGFGRLFNFFLGNHFTSISTQILKGILSLIVIWSVLAFFFPLNIYIEVFTLIVGLSSFFYFKIYENYWDFLKKNRILFPVLALLMLFICTFFPYILDFFGYYVPTIKWLTEFGLVKGIVNLDLLLGQMSFWHVYQAGFSNFSDPFFNQNAILLVVYLIYVFERKSWIHLLFIPILAIFSQSPNPDLPGIVFSLVVLNEIFLGNKNANALFALSVLAFAIKPTILWLPIFTLLYGIFILKKNLKFTILGTGIFALYIIKNLWCFGFPIFPSTFVDLGISWQPHPEILEISAKTALQKSYDLQYSYEQIKNFTFSESIVNWFTLPGIKSKIHILFVLALLVLCAFSFIQKKKIVNLLLIAILIKSLVVLTFSAQYRYLVDVFFVVFFVLFYQKISKKTALVLFSGLYLLTFSFFSFPHLTKKIFPSFRLSNYMLGFNISQLFQPSHFDFNEYTTHQIGNLKFNVVKKYPFSFDTTLPAISPEFLKEDYDAGIFPQKNTENLKDGFHWKKMSDEEKLQLKKIIDGINPIFFGK